MLFKVENKSKSNSSGSNRLKVTNLSILLSSADYLDEWSGVFVYPNMPIHKAVTKYNVSLHIDIEVIELNGYWSGASIMSMVRQVLWSKIWQKVRME